MDKFKKCPLGVLVETVETELFENADVATAILSLSKSLFSSVSVWTAKQFENDNVLRVDVALVEIMAICLLLLYSLLLKCFDIQIEFITNFVNFM